MRYGSNRAEVGEDGGGPASLEWPSHAVVEAFGFPGAGKTALCRGLHEGLGAGNALLLGGPLRDEWRARRWLRRKLLIWWSALTSPRLVLEMLALVLRLGLWRNRRAVAHLARLPVVRARLERGAPVTLLLDQAMLQEVWSAFVSAGHGALPPAAIAPLLSQLYRRVRVHVLYLELNVAAAAERISQREGGQSKFDGLPQAVIHRRLAEVEMLTGSIVEAARRAGLTISRLDAGQPPAVVLSSALEALRLTPSTGHVAQRPLPQ